MKPEDVLSTAPIALRKHTAQPDPLSLPGKAPGMAPRQQESGTVLGAMSRHLPNGQVDTRMFSAFKAVPDRSRLDGADRRRQSASSLPVATYSLKDYLKSDGNDPKILDYKKQLAQQFRDNDFNRLLEGKLTPDNQIGAGGFKRCFDLKNRQIALVMVSPYKDVKEELAQLQALKDAGFRVMDPGIPGHVSYGNPPKEVDVLIQKKMGPSCKIGAPEDKGRAPFVNSPMVNRNTLRSLQEIRNLLIEKKVTIVDPQVIVDPDDGNAYVFDPMSICHQSEDSTGHRDTIQSIDKLIQEVRQKVERRPDAAAPSFKPAAY